MERPLYKAEKEQRSHDTKSIAMKRSTLTRNILVFAVMLTSACSGIQKLPHGDKLYTGAEIKLVSPEPLSKKKKRFIKNSAMNAVRPKPNKAYLGMRPKLWLWEQVGDDPKSKFKKFLKSKGEPPVLLSGIKPDVTSEIINATIFNIGIFKGKTSYEIVEKENTAKVIYTSFISEIYRVRELGYSIFDDSISRYIIEAKDKSVIKPDMEYNLASLKTERNRIDAVLKDQGYFYFSPDYLLFKADTLDSDHKVKLTLTLKDSIPASALIAYRINQVFIDQDYSLDSKKSDPMNSAIEIRSKAFTNKDSDLNMRSQVILRSVQLKNNELYSRKNHSLTLNRLMSMGNFKFIQIKFMESDTTAPGFLDVIILMTPMTKRTFRAELEIVSKSNNFTGPRMNLSILNRNTFKGAELLSIILAGSFEAQLGGNNANSFSYSLNPQAELTLPFLLVPFKKWGNSSFVAKTRFTLSFNYLKRVNYFDMRTLQFIYGYKWKRDIRQDHEFNPVNVSYTLLANETELFNDLLDSNPYLQKSYEERFIAGGSYSYTFNDQVIPGKKIQYFMHGTLEAGGNAMSLAGMIAGKKISSDNPAGIAGSPYSQYIKVSADGRVYYNFQNTDKIAVRLFAGFARPYGNSSTLPYIKQFFSGGPNSIRAFQINSLGPGSFQQTELNTGFLQLGGDLKLEMNAEYRFTIFRFLKGALFADAGNIWLLKSSVSEAEATSLISGFSNDIAVGAGFGLRLDVSFFILRFDLATPLRKPWLNTSEQWVINQIRFGDSAWRKENLILNVAIGYPF
jgi:outer membrane protein insertion porin family